MKPEADTINWGHVHIAPLPVFHENERVQYWTQMLSDINQKLHNLEHVTLDANQYGNLWNTYMDQRQGILEELEKIS